MKRIVMACVCLSVLAAGPAMAGSNTHISFGTFSQAPIYYHQPAPIYYAPPVAYYPRTSRVYYAPHVVRYEPPCPRRYGYGVGGGRGYSRGYDNWGHERSHRREYAGVHYYGRQYADDNHYVNDRSDWNR